MSDLLPLFPLPNVVLFPNVFLPLHIFEPRYREMVADALESDRMIGMVLLRPGWDRDYEGRPPPSPSAGDIALWVPRVIFSPVYFTSEFLIRRPLGAVISAAERATLSNYILGRAMPFPFAGSATQIALTVDEMERMSLWIAQGASAPAHCP